MNKIVWVCMLLVGVINFLPVVGVISSAKIANAYGVDIVSHDLAILLRHRALLFGIVGGFVLYSLYSPQYLSAAMVLAGISMVGFLALLLGEGSYNAQLRNVALVDAIGVVLLCVAAGVHTLKGISN